MSFLNPTIPAMICGRPCTLSFDMAAITCLEEKYSITLKDLDDKRKSGEGRLALLQKMIFAMTRSMDDPPSEKDVERMSVGEVVLLQDAVTRGIQSAMRNLGETRPAAAPPAAAGSNGRGGKRSRRH